MQLVDVWVVRKVIEYLSSFQCLGAQVNLSVNLSGKTLSDTTALERIQKAVSEGLDNPESLCFEITETAAIQSLSAVVTHL